MRGDVGDVVDLAWIREIGKKANVLGIRHGPGKCLRKACIAREFDDPRVIELIGPEIGAVVLERGVHRIDHPLRIVWVLGVVIDLQVHPIGIAVHYLVAR